MQEDPEHMTQTEAIERAAEASTANDPPPRQSTALTIPTPNKIAGALEAISALVRELGDKDSEQVRRAVIELKQAARDVRALFELEVDPATGQFVIKNYGHAWMIADLLHAGGMVPSSYENVEQVVIGLMKTTELQVSPITGLANIMIVNNRPSVWGDLAQALIERSGTLEWMKEEEIGTVVTDPLTELNDWPKDYGFRVLAKRKGNEEPWEGTYTVGDARRAGLWMNSKKVPWIKDPKAMLFNRARARCLRKGFSDCLLGMGLIEEQADFIDETRLRDGGELRPVSGKKAAFLEAPETPQDEPEEAEATSEGPEPVEDAGGAPAQPEAANEGDGSLL